MGCINSRLIHIFLFQMIVVRRINKTGVILAAMRKKSHCGENFFS